MKFLILLLLSSIAHAEHDHQKSKFKAGVTCEGMVGTWYTDDTVNTDQLGRVRYITKLVRNADGSAELKGLSVLIDGSYTNQWSFPAEWSCDGEWYTEKYEWNDYVSHEIVSLGSNNILLANRGDEKSKVVEKVNVSFGSKEIEQYFRND